MKKKSTMLSSGDIAYLIKNKELRTPIGELIFVGKGMSSVKRSYEVI